MFIVKIKEKITVSNMIRKDCYVYLTLQVTAICEGVHLNNEGILLDPIEIASIIRGYEGKLIQDGFDYNPHKSIEGLAMELYDVIPLCKSIIIKYENVDYQYEPDL